MRTITSASEIDAIFRDGTRSSRNELLVIAKKTPEARDPQGRVLFVAGKRLGSAVARNRCKRVLRAAARMSGGPWPGWDVALVARPATASHTSPDVSRALTSALRRLGVGGS